MNRCKDINNNNNNNNDNADIHYGQYCIIDEESDEYPIHLSKKCKLSDPDIREYKTNERNKSIEMPAPVIRVLWIIGTTCVVITTCIVAFMYSIPGW
jgi:hypothetical protein